MWPFRCHKARFFSTFDKRFLRQALIPFLQSTTESRPHLFEFFVSFFNGDQREFWTSKDPVGLFAVGTQASSWLKISIIFFLLAWIFPPGLPSRGHMKSFSNWLLACTWPSTLLSYSSLALHVSIFSSKNWTRAK